MLIGEKTILRPPKEADMDRLGALRNDIELQMLLGAPARPSATAQIREWLGRRTDDSNGVFFVVADGADDQALGFIQITGIESLHRYGELGVCLDRAAQGKGYAAEAMRLIEGYAQDVLNLRKIVLRVLASNRRAVAFYEKRGYRIVGVHKCHLYQRGAFHDMLVMEKLFARETKDV